MFPELEKYLEQVSNLSENTLRFYTMALTRFCEKFNINSADQIMSSQIERHS